MLKNVLVSFLAAILGLPVVSAHSQQSERQTCTATESSAKLAALPSSRVSPIPSIPSLRRVVIQTAIPGTDLQQIELIVDMQGRQAWRVTKGGLVDESAWQGPIKINPEDFIGCNFRAL
jgi:hypothetical protein